MCEFLVKNINIIKACNDDFLFKLAKQKGFVEVRECVVTVQRQTRANVALARPCPCTFVGYFLLLHHLTQARKQDLGQGSAIISGVARNFFLPPPWEVFCPPGIFCPNH